jgi:hypothetical protein
MSNVEALRRYREQEWFEAWKGMTPEGGAEEATACIRQMIDEIIALGAKPRKQDVRTAVERCVDRFNEMDTADGSGPWIMSTEREDIYYVLDQIVDLTSVE